MKLYAAILIVGFLTACSPTHFVGDADRVPVTSTAPSHFDLPARFALARVVYGSPQPASRKEAALWEDLANRASRFGSFSPLVVGDYGYRSGDTGYLVDRAREQRYDYVLLVRMRPASGSADIVLVHAGSGGVMATAQAISPDGGQRGFWGGEIRNPRKLDRATLKIAQEAVPAVEELLRGMVERQASSG